MLALIAWWTSFSLVG